MEKGKLIEKNADLINRVQAGIEFLDTVHGDEKWVGVAHRAGGVNPYVLDMRDGFLSVLGQLYENDAKGCELLGITPEMECNLGLLPKKGEDFYLLNYLWRTAVASRRYPDPREPIFYQLETMLRKYEPSFRPQRSPRTSRGRSSHSG